MNPEKMNRISELTAISRQRPLTEKEKAERQSLREEYLAEWRKSAKATLDNTYVIGPDGMKRKLKPSK